MYDTFIGIDPGKSGAVGIIRSGENGLVVEAFDTPTMKAAKGTKNSYDVPGMLALITKAKEGGPVYAMLESVHSMPGQGVSSTFDFGKGFGIWIGILAALKVPYTLVSPVRWKKAMLADMTQDKGVSRTRAKQLFPDQANLFSLVKDDGRAEAVLMAEYGRRTLGAAAIVGQALAQAS
jgi:crossover junction endodeoxyribonuclease RuvC